MAGPAADAEALYCDHFGRLVTLTTGWLGDRDAAEDVVQEALIAAYAALDRGAAIARLDAWLTRVARNLAVSYLRRQARHRRLGTALLESAGDGRLVDPAEVVERRERLDGVLAALLTLPARQRDDLLLSLRVGGAPEAAAIRGLTPVAWRARLGRAREGLRLALVPPAAVTRGEFASVADRRRTVAALHARGRRPAAIARTLRLPRRTEVSDLIVLRRRSPAVVLLRQLLLFGDDLPLGAAGRRRMRTAVGARRRTTRPRPQAGPPADQLALPLEAHDGPGTGQSLDIK